MSYRVMIKLGGKVGELNLSKRDLADLCEMRPGTAGEWVRGVFESPAFNQAARICEELEIELWDFIFLDKGGKEPPKEGREERIAMRVGECRAKRKKEDAEKRKLTGGATQTSKKTDAAKRKPKRKRK